MYTIRKMTRKNPPSKMDESRVQKRGRDEVGESMRRIIAAKRKPVFSQKTGFWKSLMTQLREKERNE